MTALGVFPGSFNPLTVAHLAIVEAVRATLGVERVDLVLSRLPLAKEDVQRPLVEHRLIVLDRAARQREGIGAALTDDRLLVDIAVGYDVLVLGADKWHQLVDPRFYPSEADRDVALARLPHLAIAPRPPWPLPPSEELVAAGVVATVLDVDDHLGGVSSSAARSGEHQQMATEAIAFDRQTGAWSDPDRYESWLAGAPAGPAPGGRGAP